MWLNMVLKSPSAVMFASTFNTAETPPFDKRDADIPLATAPTYQAQVFSTQFRQASSAQTILHLAIFLNISRNFMEAMLTTSKLAQHLQSFHGSCFGIESALHPSYHLSWAKQKQHLTFDDHLASCSLRK
jgi:hypothetical protein